MTTRFLTPSEDSAIRARIARLRSQMFDLSEPEQEEAGRQIRALKAEAEPTWHAQAVQAQAERLARCGF